MKEEDLLRIGELAASLSARDEICLGLTGHRNLGHSTQIEEVISFLKPKLLEGSGIDPVLTVVTSLAEGADRVLAKTLLDLYPSSRLVSILPLAPEEYALDFGSHSSRSEFEKLLDLSDEVRVVNMGKGDRGLCYERAGKEVVDSSDLILAAWDGKKARGRGGTADVVKYARERKKTVIWIHTNNSSVGMIEVL